MARRRLRLIAWLGASAGLWLSVAGGCGGTAVVDGAGLGGGGSGAGTTTDPTSASGVVCITPEPVGELVSCGGTVGSGAGGPVQCDTRVCDTQNEWWSSCSDDGCVCYLNGIVRCSCVLDGDGQFCDGVTPSCCPEPFPRF